MSVESLFQPFVAVVFRSFLWLIPILIGLTALKILLLPRLRGREGEMLVGSVLSRIGKEVLHDVIIPDVRGSLTQLDHVVLTPAGLLVVETKNYSGLIFGTEQDAQWTQKVGRSTHRFQNPLWQNEGHIKAVQSLRLGVPVFGWVVFTDKAKFPKGLPAGVSQLSTLKADLAEQMGDGPPSEPLQAAWERLLRQARSDRSARKEHLSGLENRHGKDRKKSWAFAMLAVSAVWLIGMWSAGPALYPLPLTKASVSVTPATSSANQQRSRPAGQPTPRISTLRSPAKRIADYQEEWVPGRPIEECVGADKELNENVLRCRNGYMRKVPIYRP